MIKWNKNENAPIPRHRIRFFIFALIFSLAGLVVLVRYGMLMFNPPQPETVNPSRTLAERGPILDRNGRFLALQTRLANVSAWRPEIQDPGAIGRELAPLLNLSSAEIEERIRNSPSDFVYIKRQIDHSTIKKIEEARAAGRLRGVSLEPILGRIYPEKRLASQIIGFVGNDNNGLAGIEYAFEQDLAPPDDGIANSGQNGSQVILTLDSNIQYILEKIAGETLIQNKAEAVMLMAMDPRTGEILGSASLPDFDPNDIRLSTEQGRMDRPAIWAYEPGSVFKVFSLAALMDSEAIRGDTVFICNGHYEKTTNRGERILINCLAAHGPVNAREIIIYSCNAGAAYASDRLDTDSFHDFLREFGFGSRTRAGNPGETAGFLRSAERWSDRSKPTIAMGQEIAVSALQMLQAASAIANDGILVAPRIVSRIVSADGVTVRDYETAPSRHVLSPETARAMRSYMIDVTSSIGTGWRANLEDLSLAVKTGTAQIIDPATGAYSPTDFIASCIALLPADNPSLVLYLVIVKPQGAEYLGGRIAAPPIREAAEKLVDYLGIPRGRNPQISHSGQVGIPRESLPVIEDLVPDFRGFSKRRLLPLLLRDDLHIEIQGDGWVRRQSPDPGTPLEPGGSILLELE
jgi:cell division protein FtsI (penicillin-binding protein 3)